ncbi:MAG: hypothetical protein CK424_00890 [Legionella sp.]|nr:MAG: hypothetical protein CK424_00890 [Legionella sp.]
MTKNIQNESLLTSSTSRKPTLWQKSGCIASNKTLKLPWLKKNIIQPTPYLRKNGTLRIFLALCDEENIGRIGYVDVEPQNPSSIIEISHHPVLDIGMPGMFDDCGVLPGSLIRKNDQLYLFYTGFQVLKNGSYLAFLGLSISLDDGDTFSRVSQTPLLDRTEKEPLLRGAGFCLPHNDGFRMWYASGNAWTQDNGKCLPTYEITVIDSQGLEQWSEQQHTSISLDENEFGVTSPCVWQEDNRYKMLYSVRKRNIGYRLGYAESIDGRSFTRMDHLVGIDVSSEGWDSEMICFAKRIVCDDKTYLFYCGNHHGMEGFGYAYMVT